MTLTFGLNSHAYIHLVAYFLSYILDYMLFSSKVIAILVSPTPNFYASESADFSDKTLNSSITAGFQDVHPR